ncbi:hypothetical protein FQN50_006805 [Emmonsiellopsis sp. PD_5]|nr:hypothetical protein FQN50_006805 [Emmonsiellopsis sp. PD_5]
MAVYCTMALCAIKRMKTHQQTDQHMSLHQDGGKQRSQFSVQSRAKNIQLLLLAPGKNNTGVAGFPIPVPNSASNGRPSALDGLKPAVSIGSKDPGLTRSGSRVHCPWAPVLIPATMPQHRRCDHFATEGGSPRPYGVISTVPPEGIPRYETITRPSGVGKATSTRGDIFTPVVVTSWQLQIRKPIEDVVCRLSSPS